MRYLQANTSWFIDYESFEFVSKMMCRGPFEVNVPFYLWSYGNQPIIQTDLGPDPYSIFQKTSGVELNRLQIRFRESHRYVDVWFFDKTKSEYVELDLSCILHRGVHNQSEIVGVDYHIIFGNKIIKPITRFCPTFGIPKFPLIKELGNCNVNEAESFDVLSFGISRWRYCVVYKGHALKDTWLAFVCGTWAILLTDKLEFDSLVLLSRAVDGELGVDQIIYSVNPYIVKVKTMMK